MTTLEQLEQEFHTARLNLEFHKAMLDLYRLTWEAIGMRSTRYLQMVNRRGGMGAAKRLMSKPPSQGFQALATCHRLDLSTEALMLQPEWRDLFTAEELEKALLRLVGYGYTPKGGQ